MFGSRTRLAGACTTPHASHMMPMWTGMSADYGTVGFVKVIFISRELADCFVVDPKRPCCSHSIVTAIIASCGSQLATFAACGCLMSTVPNTFCLHRGIVDTAKGRWRINVDRFWVNMSDDSLSLEITVLNLSKNCNEFRSLLATVLRDDLQSPSRCRALTKRIVRWIEANDGDGYLNLSVAA